ncbi:MAG: cation:dicarboxylate symporter family transporter [Chitinophagaceae bacterium]
MKKSNRLTFYILIAMIAGAILGYIVFLNSYANFVTSFSNNIKLLTTIFLRLIQMIIAPLAGVSRAALIVVTATCGMFKILPEGIALILPIDHFCDMLRATTNVLGNALATAGVSKWRNSLDNSNKNIQWIKA